MFALRVVEHLDVVEYILPGFVSGTIDFSPYPLSLQQIEEAFCYRIIVAVTPSAHRMNQIVVLQERCPVHAGELRSLIRMHQNLFLWLSPPDSHEQRL